MQRFCLGFLISPCVEGSCQSRNRGLRLLLETTELFCGRFETFQLLLGLSKIRVTSVEFLYSRNLSRRSNEGLIETSILTYGIPVSTATFSASSFPDHVKSMIRVPSLDKISHTEIFFLSNV